MTETFTVHISRSLAIAICLLLGLSLSTAQTPETRSVLVDSETGEPLSLASITDRGGTMIALTGNNGEIPELPPNAFPVTFSYMGYAPLELETVKEGNIGMDPITLDLAEIVVTPGAHPLLHITGYMREYASSFGSKDSLTIYRESMVDFLIPIGKTKNKGWRKPRILTSRTYQRHTNAAGLDTVSGEADGIYLMASNLKVFPTSDSHILELPEKIAHTRETGSETVITRKKTRMDWQRNGDMIRLKHDIMAQYPGHVYTPGALKLLGATTDITEAVNSYIFINSDGSTITPADLCQISLSLKMTGRGKAYKWAFDTKTPLDMSNYIEIYITDREYLTEAEGRDLKKNLPEAGAQITVPEEAPALHTGIRRILERVAAQEK